MPKETKEVKKKSSSKSLKSIADAAKDVVKKATNVKKSSTAKKASTTKKAVKSTKAPAAKKTATSAKAPVVKKAATSTKTSTPKTTTIEKKSSTAKKTPTAKKSSTSKKTSVAKKRTTSKKTTIDNTKVLDFSPEYYDLPYRYNQTIVKILAQTPSHIFVYWDISDEDRENLKNQYGEYFFEITKPVLIVHNENLNYSFEVDINDFANSWYLNVNDSNCQYSIELGRRPIPINYNYIPNYDIDKNGPIHPVETPYIYISSSNELEVPNDHILFYSHDKIFFKNIKNNQVIEKNIKDLKFAIGKDNTFKSIYELYQELYKEELSNHSFDLNNPSSGNLSSGNVPIRYK